MRLSTPLPALLLAVAACSSSAASPTDPPDVSADALDAPGPVDSSPDAPSDATAEAGGDVTSSRDAASDAVHDPAHQCPGCQASQCMKELNACGASSTCVHWLICMNECFKTGDAGKCQQGCTAAEPTAPGKALLACDDARCHDECTP